MDCALQTEDGGFSEGSSSTEQLAVISWNEALLLPKGVDAEKFTALATLRVPAGWTVASGMESRVGTDGEVQFEEIPLARLIDSPVQIGRHTRVVEVPGSAPRPELRHRIALAADSAAALTIPDDFALGYEHMVAEAGASFGSRMYRHYTWLLTLSDHVAIFGLEHHESSDNRREELALLEADRGMDAAGLLGHEYVHSWNAKCRWPLAPAGCSWTRRHPGVRPSQHRLLRSVGFPLARRRHAIACAKRRPGFPPSAAHRGQTGSTVDDPCAAHSLMPAGSNYYQYCLRHFGRDLPCHSPGVRESTIAKSWPAAAPCRD